MSKKDEEPPGGGAYDRMSLSSLQRELEAEKARTAAARDATRDRLDAEAARHRAFPWGTLAAVLAGGVVLFFVLVYALRASFPAVAEAALPDWVYTPYDGGVRPDAGPRIVVVPDAGPPAVPRPGHGGHGGHGGHAGHGSSSGSSGGLDLGATDPTDDPIDGL